MEDDAFRHAVLAGGQEMLQALGSIGPLQCCRSSGLVPQHSPVFKNRILLDENCLWRIISCASRASTAVCIMPSSQHRGRSCHRGTSLQHGARQWHTMFAWPGSHCRTMSPLFIFPLSGLPTSTAEPGRAVQQIKPAAWGWQGDSVPKSSPNCASRSQENG